MPLSDGIKGMNGAFICYLTDFIPSKQATFDMVKTKVEKDFKAQKALTLARETAKSTALKVKEAVERVFNVVVDRVNMEITTKSQKKVFVKLNAAYDASDIASRLGML